ncbi:hypothetical protein, partial [Streptomyces spiralis]|uniref:hypothetical protein n=1 Tax=Streptomyces spiralis TaxID=66376 RepID=UPI00369C8CA6
RSQVGVITRAGHAQDPAQQGNTVTTRVRLGGALRIDERVARGYFVDSLAKKAVLDSTGQSNSAG